MDSNTISPIIINEIYNIILDLYEKLPSPIYYNEENKIFMIDKQSCQLLNSISSCMKHLPHEISSKIMIFTNNKKIENISKTIYLGCILVENGYLTINFLENSRIWCLSQEINSNGESIALLLIPNIIYSLQKIQDINQKYKFFLETWDSLSICPNPLLGLYFIDFFCSNHDIDLLFGQRYIFNFQNYKNNYFLPYTLPNYLLYHSSMMEPIITRIISLLSNPKVEIIHSYLIPLLLYFKHTKEFQKLAENYLDEIIKYLII